MRENRMKRMLKEGRPVVGCGLSIVDPFVAEVVGRFNFDFVHIDTQHHPMSNDVLQELLIALYPTESTIVVRVAWNDPVRINHVLDIGAEGIVLPWINTAEDAKAAVEAIKYPPLGRRSWGPRRAGTLYGGSLEEYAVQANNNTLFLPQIETAEAVENLDAILSVEGVDGIMIGPNDLALSMGFVENRWNPTVEATVQKVLEGCKARGKAFGMFTADMESAKLWIRRGGMIAIGTRDLGVLVEGLARDKGEIQALQEEIAARRS